MRIAAALARPWQLGIILGVPTLIASLATDVGWTGIIVLTLCAFVAGRQFAIQQGWFGSAPAALGTAGQNFSQENSEATALHYQSDSGKYERREYFRELYIDVVNHVTVPNQIVSLTYDRCTLVGPAVLLFDDQTVVKNIEAHSVTDAKAIFLEVPPNIHYDGIVVLKRCTLRDCKLVGITIAGTNDRIADLTITTKIWHTEDTMHAMVSEFLEHKYRKYPPKPLSD